LTADILGAPQSQLSTIAATHTFSKKKADAEAAGHFSPPMK